MSDDLELLPGGGFITYNEIRNFKEMKNFICTDNTGEEIEIEYNDTILEAYNYYFQIWDNCREFGLPERDWTKNPPWLLDLVKEFNFVFQEIENYRIKKRG